MSNHEFQVDPEFDFFNKKRVENLTVKMQENIGPEPQFLKEVFFYIVHISSIKKYLWAGIPFLFGSMMMFTHQGSNPVKATSTVSSTPSLDADGVFTRPFVDKVEVLPKTKIEDLVGGSVENINPEDQKKVQEFQKKLISGQVTQKDIANTVNTLYQIQNDYYKNK